MKVPGVVLLCPYHLAGAGISLPLSISSRFLPCSTILSFFRARTFLACCRISSPGEEGGYKKATFHGFGQKKHEAQPQLASGYQSKTVRSPTATSAPSAAAPIRTTPTWNSATAPSATATTATASTTSTTMLISNKRGAQTVFSVCAIDSRHKSLPLRGGGARSATERCCSSCDFRKSSAKRDCGHTSQSGLWPASSPPRGAFGAAFTSIYRPL